MIIIVSFLVLAAVIAYIYGKDTAKVFISGTGGLLVIGGFFICAIVAIILGSIFPPLGIVVSIVAAIWLVASVVNAASNLVTEVKDSIEDNKRIAEQGSRYIYDVRNADYQAQQMVSTLKAAFVSRSSQELQEAVLAFGRAHAMSSLLSIFDELLAKPNTAELRIFVIENFMAAHQETFRTPHSEADVDTRMRLHLESSASQMLVRLTQDRELRVRRAAMKALSQGTYGHTAEGMSAMVRAAFDQDDELAIAGLNAMTAHMANDGERALASIHNPADVFLGILERRSDPVRMACVNLLGSINSPLTLGLIKEALSSKQSPDVERRIRAALL